eukprot:SAG22_NODE_2703_length_2298_cov_1.492042_1_plen_212_part_10
MSCKATAAPVTAGAHLEHTALSERPPHEAAGGIFPPSKDPCPYAGPVRAEGTTQGLAHFFGFGVLLWSIMGARPSGGVVLSAARVWIPLCGATVIDGSETTRRLPPARNRTDPAPADIAAAAAETLEDDDGSFATTTDLQPMAAMDTYRGNYECSADRNGTAGGASGAGFGPGGAFTCWPAACKAAAPADRVNRSASVSASATASAGGATFC